MVKEKVNCAWHFKGQVMRKLMKETEKNDRVLIDGIKLYFPKLAAFTTVMLFPGPHTPMFPYSCRIFGSGSCPASLQ